MTINRDIDYEEPGVELPKNGREEASVDRNGRNIGERLARFVSYFSRSSSLGELIDSSETNTFFRPFCGVIVAEEQDPHPSGPQPDLALQK